jgi:hypothetical protein
VVESVIAKRQFEGIGLKKMSGREAFLEEFFPALTKHAGGKVDADDVGVAGIIIEGSSGADAEVEYALAGVDFHVGNGAGNAATDEPAEGYVVEYGMKIVDAASAGFLHGHWRELLPVNKLAGLGGFAKRWIIVGLELVVDGGPRMAIRELRGNYR